MKTVLTVLTYFLLTTMYAQTNCDTITNLTPENPYYMYEFSSAWGYMGGHNGNNLAEWAEQFIGISGTFQDVLILPGRAYAGSSTSYITVRVHNGTTAPGAVIASKQVLINSLLVDQWNKVSFDSPVTVSSDFFISFKLNYTAPQDTFVILSNSPKAQNTAWLKYPVMGWLSYQTFMNGQLNTSFGIAALMCDSTTIVTNYKTNDFIAVYPNPCNDKINICTNDKINRLYLVSSSGLMWEVDKGSAKTQTEVSLSGKSVGIYKLIVVTASGKVLTESFVKE